MKRRIINFLKRLMYSKLPLLAVGRWFTWQVLMLATRPRQAACFFEKRGRILYVAASTLPYHISGYATRTQAILQALQVSGVDAVCMTRPGYPSDRPDSLTTVQGKSTVVDGIRYWHRFSPTRYQPTLGYALRAAKPIMAEAKRLGVTRIHAASNHVNALPALVAARKLGLPFTYEMRGLWELTRISRQPDYENSHAFTQGLMLEALVAKNADRVFVISQQLGKYMQEKAGVSPKKIALLPNCVHELSLPVSERKKNESFVLGYAGSIMSYEGLDLLVQAMAVLVAQGLPIKVRMAGNGEALAKLQQLVTELGLDGYIEFLGQVRPSEAKTIIANVDAVCMPRQAFAVCHMIPPIKLVEALALGKPVILPDLPVFRDETASGEFAFFFAPGSVESLVATIEHLYASRDSLEQLSQHACAYVGQHRLWSHFVQSF